MNQIEVYGKVSLAKPAQGAPASCLGDANAAGGHKSALPGCRAALPACRRLGKCAEPAWRVANLAWQLGQFGRAVPPVQTGLALARGSLAPPDFAGLTKNMFLVIVLYYAKSSFEIAKWMAPNMLWQKMKINEIMQQL